jgi:hypothetical protein
MAIGCLPSAYEAFIGTARYPKNCGTWYKDIACNAFDQIYQLGGLHAIGYTWVFSAIFMFALGLIPLIPWQKPPNKAFKFDAPTDSARFN